MENSIVRSAKTKEEAIAAALEILGVNESEVIVTVIDEGSKGGLFGIGAKPAKVQVDFKPAPDVLVKNFLAEVIKSMGVAVRIETNQKGRFLYADLFGDNMGLLIGKHGSTLDAMQYLANLMLNKHGFLEVSVVVDTENYRKRRKETLESLARSIARKVKEKKHSVKLEPMSRFERHVIHTALQNDKLVRTYSEGDEPYRNVVIALKK